MSAIETFDLRKEYGDVIALDNLNLTVEEGEVFGFLGPNGAGKTTTIDLILDFIRPTSGSATVLGYDTQSETDKVHDAVGILPDGFDLWSRSSGYRHLEFALDSTGTNEDPDMLLDRVGLDRADAKRNVGQYSKGMLQRLAMAMALAGNPDLLILDEPSSGLDPHGIQKMQEIVREEAESGTTVFFSSHILGQVSAVCDRVGILNNSQLVTTDTIEGLRQKAGVRSRIVMETDKQPEIDLYSIDGVTDVRTTDENIEISYTEKRAKASIIHQVVESGTTVLDFDTEEATLGDLFDAYTGERGETGGDGTDATARQSSEAIVEGSQ